MSKEQTPNNLLHVPVLLEATLESLSPTEGESYLDLTAGYGGHANRILNITGNYAESVLVDRDDYAVKRLEAFSDKGTRLLHTDFVAAARQLIEEGQKFNIVLVDLGMSSPQLDQFERGFSFTNSGPLDMRMDRRQARSAHTLANTASEQELTRIITEYGEEPLGLAKTIAKAIVVNRPLSMTGELADLIKHSYRGKWKKIHPATRTFQALRIAVNDELRQIEDLLPLLPDLLKPGGRVGIISFHSLEDRLVKRYFKDQFDEGLEAVLQPLTKKPIAGDIYDVHNPRARSSKLRVAVKK
ncbi:16S rRNA (cytosine(1402)-N(4))-methyltransferase [Candidatus Saccharibacteria bacterium CG11_big_fil_rev_8_21_14_0_20_41_19]|nr:16S rRNA (cytosine(1402)-N(4))-methyltransferase RsmH [Candidatus Saccharibacteria bacterium]OIP85785.1 MAG: 16S rRNA (cytosine(1402)-N(4))-methyltransferase [Candidatus Saccharibacteria bacterium CG2_30_41_52]PIQ70901.1 MAG: 16S rRNA (cytosine(1402)-N(4))-methyltransferase [Candidatus Saccharibacteria bacterium CG11_big_fil_rev_8_21_14_0_20_41_19]PIZ61184.1 MAG: 16S rRNA (cytosine(1402)-N(4))-methyltransferase [Candidatus Saccharibacteria bacterium CG_4_10_14_0_2_um_filter_41_11]PJC29690.1 